MRVLMIAPTSFFSDYGGHIRILEEMRALQDKGVKVAVVTYYKGNDVPGLDIRRTPALPWHTDYEVGSSRHKLAFDVYLAGQALAEARRFKPDVIHGHMHEGALIGGAVGRVVRRPVVFDFQGSLTAEMVDHKFLDPDGAVYPWAYRLERFITHRMPDAILTSSARAQRLLEEEFGVAAGAVVTLPDCADPITFDPARFPGDPTQHPLRAELGIPADHIVVGYLGLLTDYQGVPHIIDAAGLLKERGEKLTFLVMGYPNVDHYRAMAVERGVADRVLFPGRVPFDEAPYHLAAGDIAVAPKMSSSEGSGKLLNYMAMAQPIVAYDTAVNREYLGDLGTYAPVGDVACFAEQIARLAHAPEERARLGRGLRERSITLFSWPAAADRIIALYRGLTTSRP
jgi:glycosyltransferase involved in cell wall biosynthesis